ncbi:MAG: DEAD/DEAH box helicase, partial [Armatimonadetes bacterium]|nr:DEAD/DEAH box helicase [Armatimonadota bacterium]
QNRAVVAVKKEMEEAQPMDRLICGDVGYGKTEVALRAAFKAIQDGKQVALLAPTTILASQHYSTFRERLATFPLTVEMLSRFKSPKEQKAIISSLTEGKVDLVVGTHRLLSRDIHFRDLGLVIIDEEQRFGVQHKEKLKKLKGLVDVLTLTATPIPRTLYLSLAGIKNMSVIETPPSGRLPVKTFLYPSDDQLIRQVILRELDRGGQVYYVHNRVETIEGAALRIRRLVPSARIAVGHGQMRDGRLEQIMLDFMEGESDILLCTTIIENGLDIPRVNTLIVEDAQNFGLAQLYQLRGRVGRSSVQAYAYLLYPPHKRITPHAEKRLEAIQEFTELGSGYYLALRDMEIRGAGNILGTRQHGHIAAIGFDLYCKLLASAVAELKGEKEKISEPIPQIDLPVTAFVPEEYVADKRQKISLYQRMAEVRVLDEVEDLREELLDRLGPIPEEVETLLSVLALRCFAAKRGIALFAAGDRQIKIKMSWGRGVTLQELERLRKHPNLRLTVKPDVLLLQLFLEPGRWDDFARELMSRFDEVTR